MFRPVTLSCRHLDWPVCLCHTLYTCALRPVSCVLRLVSCVLCLVLFAVHLASCLHRAVAHVPCLHRAVAHVRCFYRAVAHVPCFHRLWPMFRASTGLWPMFRACTGLWPMFRACLAFGGASLMIEATPPIPKPLPIPLPQYPTSPAPVTAPRHARHYPPHITHILRRKSTRFFSL
jgi:hypothetical protein